MSSATTSIQPVVQLENAMVGNCQPGPVAARLREINLV